MAAKVPVRIAVDGGHRAIKYSRIYGVKKEGMLYLLDSQIFQ